MSKESKWKRGDILIDKYKKIVLEFIKYTEDGFFSAKLLKNSSNYDFELLGTNTYLNNWNKSYFQKCPIRNTKIWRINGTTCRNT